MPTSAQVPAGTVSSLHGRASVLPACGGPARSLHVGDAILPGDRIVTVRGTDIQIVDAEGQVWKPQPLAQAPRPSEETAQGDAAAAAAETLAGATVEEVITAIDQGDERAITAAGLGGGGPGGSGSISQGLRVDRVTENLGRQEFSYRTDERAQAEAMQPLGVPSPFSTPAAAQPPVQTSVEAPTAPPAPPTPPAPPAPPEPSESSPPLAITDVLTTAEDQPVTIDVRANDTDADAEGDALTVTAINDLPIAMNAPVGLPHGVVSLNLDGTLTFTPTPDHHGTAGFTYTVSDGTGLTASASVSIDVTPVNDAPVAADDTAGTAEDRPVIIDVLANDSDVDGDTLTVTAIDGQPLSSSQSVTLAGQGTVNLNADGTLTFTPSPNFNGDVQFGYTVQDASGASSEGQVQLMIDPLSDTPVAVSDVAATLEDTPVVIDLLANDTDADGDALRITAINGQPIDTQQGVWLPGRGTVTLNADGTLTFSPAANYHGPVNFSYTVTDGLTPINGQITVNVAPVNDGPQAFDDRINTPEDTAIEVAVRANDRDVDGDLLAVTAVSQGAHGSVAIDPLTGNPVYTPADDYAGTDSFSYTVTDPDGATSTATVTVTVGGTNDAPIAQADQATLGQDGALVVNALNGVIQSALEPAGRDGDPDGDTLAVVAVGHGGTAGQVGQALAGTYGTLVLQSDGSYSYAPNDAARALGDGMGAQDVFSYTVRDGGGLSSTTTLSITVTGRNDAPVAAADRATTPEDTTVVLHVLDNDTDVDGDPLHITQIDGRAVVAGGSVTIADPVSGAAIAVVSLNADGTLTLDPTANYQGPIDFSYTVSDGATTSTGQVSVAVDSANDAPVAGDDVVQGLEDAPFTFDPRANDSDAEGDPLTVTHIDGQPIGPGQPVALAQGTVSMNDDGSLTFTPTRDASGALSFQYTVSDGQGAGDTATVNMSLTPVNDPPVVTDTPADPAYPGTTYDPSTGHYAAITLEDTPVSGQVKATDADGDVLTYTLGGTLPAHGSVVVNMDGTWTYTPAAHFSGGDQFTVLVSDGHGGTVVSAITVGVTPVDDPAVIAGGSASLSEEGLAYGLADSLGALDTTDSTTASGQLSITDVDGGPLDLWLSAPSGLSSGGVAIAWSGSGTAADPLVGTAGGRTVLTASIDDQGRYQVALQAPVDHADASQEDLAELALTVHASNGVSTSTSALALQFEDDAPATGAQVQYVASSTQDTNVMLVIDRSGSMNNALSDHTVNGLKAALKGMLDHYGDIGDVRVQIVTFSDAATGGSSWLTLSAAKTFIDTLSANGGTNYDAALAAAQTAFLTPGKLSGAANVAYFLSDGQPTQGNEIDNAADRATWETFLRAHQIDAHAVGLNGATPAMLPYLDPVAYDGSTGTERPAVLLSTTADVKAYLDNSVAVIEHGNLSSLAGADGLKAVTAFSAANQTSSHIDAATNQLTLELGSGNRLVLNMATGEYTYTRHAGSLGDTFSYTVVDGDGDSGSGSLTLTRQNTAPEGKDATITLNEDTSHTFQLANFGFQDSDVGDRLAAVRIDTVPGDGQLLLQGQAVTAGQVILAQDIGSLVFTPDANDNGTGYAQVSFSVRDQAGVYDATPNTITFNVTPVNDMPIAQVTNQGGTLLGLLDVSVNPVLDLSRDQLVGINDVDHNLTRIDITVRELLSVGGLTNALLVLIGLGGDHSKLTLNTDFALTHGLVITGNDTRHITIESATPGRAIDVHQVNQLLSTLVYDPAELLGIQADLLPTMTIHATDAFGATSADSASAGLITVNVNTVQQLLGTDDNQTLIGGDNTHDTVDAGRGNDVVIGGGGHDHLSGGTGHDLVSGGDGNDFIFGNDGNDQLYGGRGQDLLNGGAGDDYLHGGSGSDLLSGGLGSDVFAWRFADEGVPTPQGRPVDTITDFDIAARAAGGDMLDLRDLLSGENTLGGTGNLDQFLDFDTSSSPGSTIVHISSAGGFTNGTYTPGAEDQRVVLQNVDLRGDLGLAAASNDHQVIAELMNRGKLLVDSL